jgi:hypothetical protein
VSRVSCNTEPRTPNSDSPPPVSTSGAAYALTPVSLSFDREIAIREFAFPDAQGHGPYKTPNPDSSGSCATCTLSDQRLGIATRDFSRCNRKTSLRITFPEAVAILSSKTSLENPPASRSFPWFNLSRACS